MVRTHKGTLSCTCPKGFGTKFPSELPLASILIPKLVGIASQVRHSFISFAGSWKDNCGFYESSYAEFWQQQHFNELAGLVVSTGKSGK